MKKHEVQIGKVYAMKVSGDMTVAQRLTPILKRI